MPDTTIRAFVEGVGRSARLWVQRRRLTATRQQRQTWRLTASATTLGLAVALTAVAVAGPWDSGQRTAERARAAAPDRSGGTHIPAGPRAPEPAPSAPEVLTALGDGTVARSAAGGDNAPPAPTPAALADALGPLLKDDALGSVRTASVVDAVSGKPLFSAGAKRTATPASTVKLATAAAALSARGADHRIETRVVGGKGRAVLVGGGDPTLSRGDLAALAKHTARALKDGGTEKVRLRYDTSLFSGRTLHPIGRNPNLAPVSSLMVGEARLDDSRHGPAPRAPDPARQAAEHFARQLAEHGVAVLGRPREATAREGAEQLAVHRSAPLSALVEEMLTYSDNDIAEALFRQTALASGAPANFKDGGRAVRKQLAKLDLPLNGARFADGSGLSRDDEVSARLLTGLLARAAEPGHPELRSLLTGLPVAHFTGTLDGRYDEESRHGAGLVRAKTGTLTGVNTLAGTVVDADGRLLAFAFMTTGTEDRYGAQQVLDRLAATLADCGCRA